MFQHVLSSNAGTIQEFFIPFYRSIRGVKISIGFYEIQCKYIKENFDNVGLVILLAIFLPVSKRTKWWNKWLSLGSRECYQNKEWANSCRNLWLNLEIPKTFLRSKCHEAGKQTPKCKQQGNLSWVDFWSIIARQWKQTNWSGVINVHFKPT